jgi:hypothetical protein
MSIVNLWQEARGNVLRKKWDKLKCGIDAADYSAKSACLGYIRTRSESLDRLYARSSSVDQKRIYKRVAEESLRFLKAGDWPSACGLYVMMLNIESRYLPGGDAACIKVETDALIKEATAVADPSSLGRTDIGANNDDVARLAGLEARGAIPMQALQEASRRATGRNNQVDQDARDRAPQVGVRAGR